MSKFWRKLAGVAVHSSDVVVPVLPVLMGWLGWIGQTVPALAQEGYARPEFYQAVPEAPEPPEFKLGTPGVCRLYNLSGYLAIAADGQLVTLQPYCRQQRNWAWYAEERFWRRFRNAATPTTLAFAQTLEQAQIEAYAQAICPFLADGGTLQELAQLQMDQRLPLEFEQAVTTAAIRTYCRQYRDQLPSD